MEMWQWIVGGIMAVIAIALGVYAFLTSREKGPILSNSYIWLSPEERKKADKKAEYHLVTVIFGGLFLFFLLETVYVLTLWKPVLGAGFCVLGLDAVYAIADSVKSAGKKGST